MSDVHHDGGTDALLVKYDSVGNIVWKRNIGGTWGDKLFGIAPVLGDMFMAVGGGPRENDPEEEEPDAGNPIGSHPISCNTDGTCNILPGMNKMEKTQFILANIKDNVDITNLILQNYSKVVDIWD